MVITLKYLICNLKAHKTYNDMLIYKDTLRDLTIQNINLILAPSAVYLPIFKSEGLKIASQDIPLEEQLKLTGDISIEQLKSLNVSYTIIGHYERRKYYHENEQIIISKIKNALKNGLQVIYCIGESFEERARKVEYQVIEKQIARIFNSIPTSEIKNIIIAYEPTYMIGKDVPLDIKHITSTINFIKNLVNDYYHSKIRVVYGGNVNPNTVKELKEIKNLDGYIIGSSSKSVESLKNIIEEM